MGAIFAIMKLVWCFIPCFVALNCFQKLVSGSGTLARDEVEALRDIANQLGKTNWNFSVDPCTGEGNWIAPTNAILSSVTCDCPSNATCHVIRIVLVGESLPGVLPPDLYRLPYLTELDLSRNYLSGSVPSQWSNMSLRDLHVMGNRLSGPFPTVLTNITTLRNLSIEGNDFTGTIPRELGNLINLQKLVLQANKFSGELPATLAKLTKLTDLRISSNNFSGKIPDFISAWTQMDKLHVQGCSFEGPIPSAISALTNLTDLRISDINGGESSFPQLENMTLVETLILRNCSINGSIPEYMVRIGRLHILDLSFNSLTGEIPTSFVNLLPGLNFMYLTGNMLNGSIPSWILESNKNIDVSNNNFIWENSSQCPQGSINLVESHSSTVDKISGIPSCLQNFPCLDKANRHSLYINCGGREVTINGTKYEADLMAGGPSTFYQNPNWAFSSTGNFMDTQGDVGKYIETNESALSNISISELELYRTARVSPLSLTYYGLCLMNGNYTVRLHFAEIAFTNDNRFSSLGKRIFNVFIQGKIVLKDFNIEDEARRPGRSVVKTFAAIVTNHTLEVQFYWAGKGTTAIPRRGVYGPLISAISMDPNFEIPSNLGKIINITIEVLGSVLFVILLVSVILWRIGYLGGKGNASKDEDLGSLELKIGSFTLRHIKAATKNFDAANKIGEGGFGSVYKGLLSDGTVIAVKKLSAKSKQGNREFLNEIGLVSALQHPNLVKLYGCCMEHDQLMLIYEYMENNCLSRALFGRDAQCRLNLDWRTRHKICLGIARGLAYCHEESMVKIVHRDIKASNVLLDKDLNAKISDFGLAKLYEEDESHISTRVAGTIGYMAPEYAIRGCLTYKADVYSFGVVALEIVSGMSNTSYRPKEEFVYLLDWAYVLQGRGCLLELVDPNLGLNFSKEEATVMLNVALLCTNASPNLRPSMSTVVSMLEGRTNVEPQLSGPETSSIHSSCPENNFWQVPGDRPGVSVHTSSCCSSGSAECREDSGSLLRVNSVRSIQ